MSVPFALEDVQKVTFFKRDEVTTDLICCEVVGTTDINHEESASWSAWIATLASLPGFDCGWFAKVSQPAFAPSATIAFERPLNPLP